MLGRVPVDDFGVEARALAVDVVLQQLRAAGRRWKDLLPGVGSMETASKGTYHAVERVLR